MQLPKKPQIVTTTIINHRGYMIMVSLIQNASIIAALIAFISAMIVAFVNLLSNEKRLKFELVIKDREIELKDREIELKSQEVALKQAEIDGLTKSISELLIKSRMEQYPKLFKLLEGLSGVNSEKLAKNRQEAESFHAVFQTALFSEIGIIASHEVRQVLLLARDNTKKYVKNEISNEQFFRTIWAVHMALRGDLGISQPDWDSTIQRTKQSVSNAKSWQTLIEEYPYEHHSVTQRHLEFIRELDKQYFRQSDPPI